MSYLAIGAVTKSIAELLAKKMNKPPLLGDITPKVTTLPPDDERVDDNDSVNLFLYRVSEDPYNKNMDWRGDKSNSGARRPALSLNLYYLLTGYAKKSNGAGQDDVTSHQLLGNAMAILNEHPVLNDVHDGDFDADLNTQFPQELRESFEKIKVTLMPNSMEEFSKIWTGLNKAYRLSVTYEVSLVQIAPITPTSMPGPVTQQISLDVSAASAPAIVSITPSKGPAGAQVTLEGKGFRARGAATIVMIDDLQLDETDVLTLSEDKIVLKIPEALQRGPKLRLSVIVGSHESEAQFYEVSPWISSIQPLRGFTEVPLTFAFEVPLGATVAAEIDGQVVVATIDDQKKIVLVTVPATITTNGPKPVVLIVNDGTPKRSNARLYEVLPMITKKTVTTDPDPAKTTIALEGKRLKGTDISVRYGKLLINKGENLSATTVTVDIDKRILPANLPISVLVDGRESNVLPPRLDGIDPPQAFAGDEVVLTGSGLSGQSVSIDFGGTPVDLGPQGYAGRLKVKVPDALGAGTIAVKISVNGIETNTRSFEVLG